MAESHNLRHKNSLRTKTEIQQEMNQRIFELGNAVANTELLKEQFTRSIESIKRLAKEQARPEKKATADTEVDGKVEETTEAPLAADTTAQDAHVTQ
jgi:hypothetical protein